MTVEVVEIERVFKDLHDAMSQIPNQMIRLGKEIELCQQETSDLLHLIEFSNFNASEGYKLSRDVQITQQKRRQLKNELESLTQISKKLKTPRQLDHQIDSISNVISKRKETIKNSKYSPRVRSDLIERFNKCHINQL